MLPIKQTNKRGKRAPSGFIENSPSVHWNPSKCMRYMEQIILNWPISPAEILDRISFSWSRKQPDHRKGLSIKLSISRDSNICSEAKPRSSISCFNVSNQRSAWTNLWFPWRLWTSKFSRIALSTAKHSPTTVTDDLIPDLSPVFLLVDRGFAVPDQNSR